MQAGGVEVVSIYWPDEEHLAEHVEVFSVWDEEQLVQFKEVGPEQEAHAGLQSSQVLVEFPP